MEREFHEAAVEGNFNAFEEMDGEQIESILTPNEDTILHVHLTNYNDSSVSRTFVKKVLQKSPALFLRTNAKGETILHIAARYGHHKIVRKLFELARDTTYSNEVEAKKKIIRAQNHKKDTALHEAARYSHMKVVDILTKEEPDHLHFGQNVDGETPLYIAVERQYWHVVDKILGSRSPQYGGPNGRNALHAAVLHRVQGKVSVLLERKPSAAEEADENGWVPLHLAAIAGSPTVVEELVSKDRRAAYMQDKKGRTALHFAAICRNISVMEKILEHCPDCYQLVDEKGDNALHYIMMRGRISISALKQIPPPVRDLYNEKDNDGNTPFHILARHAPKMIAVCDDHPPLEEEFPLLDKMAFNEKGQTILDVAIANGPPHLACKNKIKLQDIGVKLGARVTKTEKTREERLFSSSE